MLRPKTLICLTLAVFTTSSVGVHAQDSYGEWLGPQTNEKATLFAPVVGEPIDPKKHEKLSRYEITLEIVKGVDLELPSTDNAIVTFEGKGFQQLSDFQADEDATYLVGTMQLKKNAGGWRFYTLNVRVTEGKLKGAVVHLRDGKIQESTTDPCIAIYRIPDDLKVDTGKVPFEVVALFAK